MAIAAPALAAHLTELNKDINDAANKGDSCSGGPTRSGRPRAGNRRRDVASTSFVI
jgi:hypothetical protein